MMCNSQFLTVYFDGLGIDYVTLSIVKHYDTLSLLVSNQTISQ